MKTVLSLVLLLLLCGEVARAQRSATCTITNFQRNSGVYSFDVWARRTNATGSLLVGTSQFFFDFNNDALSTPVLTNINPRYTGPADSTGDYLPMDIRIILFPGGNKIAVTIWFLGNDLGVGQALSTDVPNGERMCTVNLTITDASQLANLYWDEVNSAFTTTNLQPVSHTFVGFDESPLPIQLLSFTATLVGARTVRLDWTTLTEIGNYGFEMQRRVEGLGEYQTLPNSFVPGNGTTQVPHDYSWTDSSAPSGVVWYRLRQIDLDGTVHYTDGVQVEVLTSVPEDIPVEFALHQNFPNPFNPATRIAFALAQASYVRLVVYNVLGQEVALLADEARPVGRYALDWRAESPSGDPLGSGVYFYRLEAQPTDGGSPFVSMKKMILLK